MDWTIKVTDMAIVFATVLGPILAVQAQKWVERTKSVDDRRRNIFRILMATRATPLSGAHVEALNQVLIEFHGPGDSKLKAIINAWHAYLEQLGIHDVTDELAQKRRDTHFDLLFRMSEYLGYPFTREEIRNDVYYPSGHVQIETDQATIRRGFARLLSGEFALPMAVKEFPANPEAIAEQDELRKLLLEWLEGKRAVKVV